MVVRVPPSIQWCLVCGHLLGVLPKLKTLAGVRTNFQTDEEQEMVEGLNYEEVVGPPHVEQPGEKKGKILYHLYLEVSHVIVSYIF